MRTLRTFVTLAVAISTIAILAPEACSEPPLLLTWGSLGTEPGQFYPFQNHTFGGVATDGSGNVYVTDGGPYLTGRIQKFTGNGVFLTQWLGAFGPMAVDDAGNVFAADKITGRIKKFGGDGTLITDWELPDCRGIAVAAGIVYAATAYKVHEFTTDGSLIRSFGRRTGFPVQPGTFYGIISLDVSSDGFVYVGDAENRVLKFTTDSTYVTEWVVGYPEEMDLTPTGDLYVYTWLSCQLVHYRVQGSSLVWIETWASCDPDQWINVEGLATDLDGNLFVADRGKDTYGRYPRMLKYGDAPTPTNRTTWGRIKSIYR